MVVATALFVVAAAVSSSGGVALAHDGADTARYGIVNASDDFNPSGSTDDSDNGYRIYLSSPRHSNSGSRGECMNPGRQENVNGREWNWYAANGFYYAGLYQPSSHNRNVHSRGYRVRLSPNTKDDGYMENSTASQNYGSDLHIVTHTNAAGNGCPNSTSYFLAIYRGGQQKDQDTAQAFYDIMKDVAPGGQNIGTDTAWFGGTLAELSTNASMGDAYMELVFHTNQSAQSWIYSETDPNAWNYGYAVDTRLGYPS